MAHPRAANSCKQLQTSPSSLTSSSSLSSDASPKRSNFSRHVKELSVIYHRFNQAIKTETALVHKGVQHLISSGDTGEVGIFCQIAVAPSPEVANEVSLSFLFASLIDSRPVLRWLVHVYPQRDPGSPVDQLFLAHTCLSEAVLPDCLLIELKKSRNITSFYQ